FRNSVIAARPSRNSARLRHLLSIVYASATLSGLRLFQPSSAPRTFCIAVSCVKGGNGGRCSTSLMALPHGMIARSVASCITRYNCPPAIRYHCRMSSPDFSPDLAALADLIKQWARELGFQQAGIADLDVSEQADHLRNWLANHYHGE